MACCLLIGLQQAVRAQVPAWPVVVPTPAELAPKPEPIRSDPKNLPQQPLPPELPKPEGELWLDVKAYSVSPNAPPELAAALEGLTRPYAGGKRSFEDLVNAAAEVTRYLQRDLGYYVGLAYIPAQDPVDGVVRIEVLEGRLDRTELVWSDNLPVRREVVQAYLDRLQPGSIIRVRDLERVVFLINDLRGLNARFDIMPGAQPGTAALVVTPRAEPRWALQADVDNNGSRFLGTQRLGGLVSANSLLGRGDALTLNALASVTGGLAFALAGYTLPVGNDGWKLGGSLSLLRYKLDATEFPLGVNGDALNLTAYALYPWVRSRNLNLFVLGSVEYKDYTDRRDVSGTVDKKQVQSLALGMTGDFRDSVLTGGINTYELTYAAGQVRYAGGPLPGSDDDANYSKLVLSFNRLQNIIDSRLLLYASVRAQLAFNNLDTTEQFRLGGPDSVRAFAPGEGTGDTGAVMTAELRLLPPESVFGRVARDTVLGLFYDAGRITFRHDASLQPSSFVKNASFSGAGLSFAWVRPDDFFFRISLAKPVSGTPKADTKASNLRVYAQFSKHF